MCVCSRLLSYHIAQPAVLTPALESVSRHPHGIALKLISWVMRDQSFSAWCVVWNILGLKLNVSPLLPSGPVSLLPSGVCVSAGSLLRGLCTLSAVGCSPTLGRQP